MRGLSHLPPLMLVGALTLAGPTLAQAPPGSAAVTPGCHSHSDLAAMLDHKFAERPNALGLQADGHLVEVFVSNDGTSWTIVVTRPDGWSCIVAVGEHWESLPNPVTGPLA
ncbi:MAG: hypothetical protein ACREJ5_27515 [Geminicoccaceae bacterium]